MLNRREFMKAVSGFGLYLAVDDDVLKAAGSLFNDEVQRVSYSPAEPPVPFWEGRLLSIAGSPRVGNRKFFYRFIERWYRIPYEIPVPYSKEHLTFQLMIEEKKPKPKNPLSAFGNTTGTSEDELPVGSLFHYDTHSIKTFDFQRAAENLTERTGHGNIRFVLVDYVGLMRSRTGTHLGTGLVESLATGNLKRLAEDLKIDIAVLTGRTEDETKYFPDPSSCEETTDLIDAIVLVHRHVPEIQPVEVAMGGDKGNPSLWVQLRRLKTGA